MHTHFLLQSIHIQLLKWDYYLSFDLLWNVAVYEQTRKEKVEYLSKFESRAINIAWDNSHHATKPTFFGFFCAVAFRRHYEAMFNVIMWQCLTSLWGSAWRHQAGFSTEFAFYFNILAVLFMLQHFKVFWRKDFHPSIRNTVNSKIKSVG